MNPRSNTSVAAAFALFLGAVCALAMACGSTGGSSPTDAGPGTPAGDARAPDARAPDGGCTYKDFHGNEVFCPIGGRDVVACPSSRDGCNDTYCMDDGTVTANAAACGCPWTEAGFDAGGIVPARFPTTAPDGCSVCTCAIPPDGGFRQFELTCDRSKCP